MPGLEHVSLLSCTRGDESRLGFGNRTVRWGDVTPGTFVITYECVGCFLRWHAPTAAPLPDIGIDWDPWTALRRVTRDNTGTVGTRI